MTSYKKSHPSTLRQNADEVTKNSFLKNTATGLTLAGLTVIMGHVFGPKMIESFAEKGAALLEIQKQNFVVTMKPSTFLSHPIYDAIYPYLLPTGACLLAAGVGAFALHKLLKPENRSTGKKITPRGLNL